MDFKVKIENQTQWTGQVAISILGKQGNEHHQASPCELLFVPIQLGEMTSPCIRIDEDNADNLLRALAQGLAEAGYLPDVSCAKDNELAATKYHLEDMRRLTFGKVTK